MGRRYHGIAMLLHGRHPGFVVRCGVPISGLGKSRKFIAPILVDVVAPRACAIVAFT